jgi:hypothetical protein
MAQGDRFGGMILDAPPAASGRDRFGGIVLDATSPSSEESFGGAPVEVAAPPAPQSFGGGADVAEPPKPADPMAGMDDWYAGLLAKNNAMREAGVDIYKHNMDLVGQAAAEEGNALTNSFPAQTIAGAGKAIGHTVGGAVGSLLAEVGFPGARETVEQMQSTGRANAAKREYLNQGSAVKNTIQDGVDMLATSIYGAAVGGGTLSGMAAFFGGTTAANHVAQARAQGTSATDAYLQGAAHGLVDAAWTIAGGKIFGAGLSKLVGAEGDNIVGKLAQKVAEKYKLPAWPAKIAGGATGQLAQGEGQAISQYMVGVAGGEHEYNGDELLAQMKAIAGPSVLAGAAGPAVHAFMGKVVDTISKRMEELPRSVQEKIGAFAEHPSRSTARAAGVDEIAKTDKERRALAEAIKESPIHQEVARISEIVKRAVPNAKVDITQHPEGGFILKFPAGDVRLVEEHKIATSEQGIAYNLKNYGLDDTPENRKVFEDVQGSYETGRGALIAKDGTRYDGLGLIRIKQQMADGRTQHDVLRHELVHLATRTGLFTHAELLKLTDKYLRPGKRRPQTGLEIEEFAAQATEAWGGNRGLLSRIDDWIDRLLELVGVRPKGAVNVQNDLFTGNRLNQQRADSGNVLPPPLPVTESPTAPVAAPPVEAVQPTVQPVESPQPPSATVGARPEPPVEPPAITEPPPSTDNLTAAKRAFVDRDRSLLGLEEIPDAETQGWAENLLNAKRDGIPESALGLANEVLDKPRAFTPDETAGVVIRMAELKNKHAALTERIKAAKEPTRADTGELNQVETDLDTLTRATRASGTEKGRALAAQKLTINQDYDLASVVTRAKIAKGTAPTPEERAKLASLTNKGERAKKRLESLDKKDKKVKHREVSRIKSAVASIRKQLGLDEISEANAAVPGLTDKNRAELDVIREKLREAENSLDKDLISPERVHNRPSEIEVSNLDDAIGAVRKVINERKGIRSSAEVEQKKIAALQKKLDDINNRVENRDVSPQQRSRLADVASQERARLNQEIATSNDALAEIRRTVALEKRLAAAQETLRKIQSGEITKLPSHGKHADVMSEQRTKLNYDLDKTHQEIRHAIDALKPKTLWGILGDVKDVSMGLITSTDLSAVLRQSKYSLWSHPLIAAQNLKPMLRSFASDRADYAIEKEILSRPNARLYDLGMTILRRDMPLESREEFVASEFLKKVPLVAGSQRAYRTYINLMRADTFDALADIQGGKMGLSYDQYKMLGHAINVGTGRGTLRAADKHMHSAGLVLFAPRFLLSRIQYELGEPFWRSDRTIKKIVAKEYARSMLGAAMWYGLYGLAFGNRDDFSITLDPRSSDFGKIRLGRTRIDPLAGISQLTRFAIRMFSSKTVDERGRVKKMSPYDKLQEEVRFARGKSSPLLSSLINLSTGSDISNRPVNVTSLEGGWNLGAGLVAPINTRDILNIYKEQGIPTGTALSILNTFGEGVQIYDKKKK